MSYQLQAGCNKQCLCKGVEQCVVGWPDGSCGARGQGTQWPKDVRAKLLEDDWTMGDVIYAEPDGTIILDDGLTTHNQVRADAFLSKAGVFKCVEFSGAREEANGPRPDDPTRLL